MKKILTYLALLFWGVTAFADVMNPTSTNPLFFNGSAQPSISSANHAKVYYDLATNALKISQNGSGYTNFTIMGGGGAPSTDNAVARFDGIAGQLQNSAILIDDSNNFSGINNATINGQLGLGAAPGATPSKLDVKATADVTGTGTVSSVGTAITGVGTLFLTELNVGDRIKVGGVYTQVVLAIADNLHLTIDYQAGVDYSAQSFTIIKPSTRFLDSSGAMVGQVYSNGDLQVRTIQATQPLNYMSIGPVFNSGLPELAFGFADITKNHRFRSSGGGNNNLQLDIVGPDAHYFAVDGLFENTKGIQTGYAIGTTPPVGGLSVSGYSKIGGVAISTAPTVSGDPINFEIGSGNATLGTMAVMSDNSFVEPFTSIHALGIPDRVFSFEVEGNPAKGGLDYKINNTENAPVLHYEAGTGVTTNTAGVVLFSVFKSDGSGGKVKLDTGDVGYDFQNKSSTLFKIEGAGKATHTINSAAAFVFDESGGQSLLSVENGGFILKSGANPLITSAGNGALMTINSFNSGFVLDTPTTFNTSVLFKGNIGFFNTSPVAQQAVGATLTNNVTGGGTPNVIDDIAPASTDMTAAKLTDTQAAIYRLTEKVRTLEAALKTYGIVTN